MASLESYEEAYSDEEEGDDWQDQDPSGEGGVASWNKDHQIKNSQISELISVADFKAQCSEKIPHSQVVSHSMGDKGDNDIAQAMGITMDELKKVQEECKHEKLVPPGGVPEFLKMDLSPFIQSSPFRSMKEATNVRNIFHRLPTTYGYDLKTRGLDGLRGTDPVSQGEVILCIAVYHPFTKTRDQEFVCLGSQKLTTLRDVIVCPNDYFVTHDFSEDPSSYEEHLKTLPNPPNLSPSAFFFFNNTFYNDLRHPQSIDISKSIIEWASVKERREQSRRLEHFNTDDMATTSFDQLTIRLGYPYLYTHHSNCEHLIMVTDLRLYQPTTDYQSISDYPRLVFKHRRKLIRCAMCKLVEPKWATFNDDLAPSCPCHFCDDCFKKLHYTPDGKKVANFEAYPYHPESH